jgi:hypothetical protein
MGAGERSAERFVRFVSSYSCTCVYVLVRSNIYNIDSNLNVETSPHTPVRLFLTALTQLSELTSLGTQIEPIASLHFRDPR